MNEIHRIRVFEYSPSSIVSISLDDSCEVLLVARTSGYLEIWNIKKHAFVMANVYITYQHNIRAVSWCKYQGESAIAIGLLSGELMLVAYPSLKFLRPTNSYGSIFSLAVNSKKDKIAIACSTEYSGVVNILNISDNMTLIASSDGFMSPVMCVCFDENDVIYAGTKSGIVQKVDSETGRFITTYENQDSVYAITAVAGGGFATGDAKGNVMIWDPITATVTAKFESHKADIKSMAASGKLLWASGIDPTVACFSYSSKNGTWIQKGHTRFHTHEVTCLAATNKQSVISGSLDSTLFIKKTIYPFQFQPPISSALRNEDIIVAGGAGHSLSVWKLDGKQAKLELTVKTDVDKNYVESVALAPGGETLVYCASVVKMLKFNSNNGQWSFDENINLPAASTLVYSNQGILYLGYIDGTVRSEKGESINVGFPVFKVAISSNGKHIVAGGFENIVLLDEKLSTIEVKLPSLGTPFSTFKFQPFKNRLFISTGTEKVTVYNVLKKEFLPKLITKFGKHGDVAVNSICFAADNPSQVLMSSSQRAIIRNLKKPELGLFRLPYNDILYVTFVGPKQIIIFEKPWAFTVNGLPDVYRMKRFMTRREENHPRY